MHGTDDRIPDRRPKREPLIRYSRGHKWTNRRSGCGTSHMFKRLAQFLTKKKGKSVTIPSVVFGLGSDRRRMGRSRRRLEANRQQKTPKREPLIRYSRGHKWTNRRSRCGTSHMFKRLAQFLTKKKREIGDHTLSRLRAVTAGGWAVADGGWRLTESSSTDTDGRWAAVLGRSLKAPPQREPTKARG